MMDPYKHMTVKHHFVGGIYTKEMHIPPGFKLESHRHSFDHQSILISGTAIVEVDGEQTQYTGPSMLTVAAKKVHAITAVTPLVWLCQHVTSCTDPENIDAEFIDRSAPCHS